MKQKENELGEKLQENVEEINEIKKEKAKLEIKLKCVEKKRTKQILYYSKKHFELLLNLKESKKKQNIIEKFKQEQERIEKNIYSQFFSQFNTFVSYTENFDKETFEKFKKK